MLIDKYEDYLNYEKNFSNHTISAYLSDIEAFENFLVIIGEKLSVDINYSFIRQWIVYLSEKKYSKTSINRKIASLKSTFKSYLKSSPC